MLRRIYKMLFYTTLTVVYGIFFSIESFYNFEGHSEVRELIGNSCLVHLEPATAGAREIVQSYPMPHKVRMRLNKRFHHEDFPLSFVPVFQLNAPVVTLIPDDHGSLPVAPLPSVTPVHPQLRGPPYCA